MCRHCVVLANSEASFQSLRACLLHIGTQISLILAVSLSTKRIVLYAHRKYLLCTNTVLHQVLRHRHPSGMIPVHCRISQHDAAMTQSLLAQTTSMNASAPQSLLVQTTFTARTWVNCVLIACVMFAIFRHFTMRHQSQCACFNVRHDAMCRQSQDMFAMSGALQCVAGRGTVVSTDH